MPVIRATIANGPIANGPLTLTLTYRKHKKAMLLQGNLRDAAVNSIAHDSSHNGP